MTGGPAGRAAVFLDRDGTLNEDRGYVGFRRDFAWLPGAVEAVRRLNEAGLFVVVVTNQAGVARGHYSEEDVRRLHDEVQADLAAAGARVDAFYYAPYHPTAAVVARYARAHPDRKPGTGMFERAIRAHGLAPARSFVVGDKESDVTPGKALGLTAVLVRTGFGRDHESTTAADFVMDDVAAAADLLLRLHAERAAGLGASSTMITLAKLKTYKEFGGNGDLWSRVTSERERQRSGMTSEDWATIDLLLHRLTVVENGLASEVWAADTRAMLEQKVAGEAVAAELRAMSTPNPPLQATKGSGWFSSLFRRR